MAYVVAVGYVTVPTNVGRGVAHVDIPRGATLPRDVPREDVDRLLALGHIEEPDGSGVDENEDGVPEGSARQVMEWVGSDPERAAMALDAEQAKGDNARSTLIASLQKLVEA